MIIDFDSLTVSNNLYELLGVTPLVDGATLHKAFRRLSKQLHPDTTSLPQDEAAHRFREVCEAYELLADPKLRKAYDAKNLNKQLEFEKVTLNLDSFHFKKTNLVGNRRPLSGGELFSLLLLGLALSLSLLFGIGFAMAQGRDLMVRPSWLVIDQSVSKIVPISVRHDFLTFYKNSIKSTFFRGY